MNITTTYESQMPHGEITRLVEAIRVMVVAEASRKRSKKSQRYLDARLATLAVHSEAIAGDLTDYIAAPNDETLARIEHAILADPSVADRICAAMGWPSPIGVVLRKELDEIRSLREQRGRPDTNDLPPSSDPDLGTRANDYRLIGLAFSGGGIRSATFNLGVLQGLAQLDLLKCVDYLSTVSGGGYIGSWLGAWTKRNRDFEITREALIPAGPLREVDNAVRPIGFLRQYSNYLTPQLGILSADTWTMAVVYVRNVILNLLILVTGIAAVLLLPRFFVRDSVHSGTFTQFWFEPVFAVLGVGIALAFVILNLRYVASNGRGAAALPSAPFFAKQGSVQLLTIVPILVAVYCLSKLVWAEARHLPDDRDLLLFAFFFALCFVAAVAVQALGGFITCYAKSSGKVGLAWFLIFVFALTAASAGVGLLWLLLKAARALPDLEHQALVHFVIWGPPMLLVVLGLAGTLLVGLMGLGFPDSGREWFGRFGAWVSIYSVAWLALFAAAIYGPVLIVVAVREGWVKTAAAAIAGWIGTTIASVLAAQSSTTGKSTDGQSKSTWLDLVAKIGPPVFMIGFFVFIGFVLDFLIIKSRLDGEGVVSWYRYGSRTTHWGLITGTAMQPASIEAFLNWPFEFVVPLFLILAIVAVYLAWRVDINEFSMHHFYKNRLVRCYLGASNPNRKPNPFTGFDDSDDVPLKELRPSQQYTGPYPIINAALNFTAGDRLAWQERMAAPFVFTPLYCGFDASSEGGRSRAFGRKALRLRPAGYRDTASFAYPEKGIGIGTALAISGAAVSPNQGYHSSLFVAFLLTVFNVRLGWWLGNPRKDDASKRSGPPLGLMYLVKELFGFTSDRANYVSVSDGGHFENLGIYELIRRRCTFIVACDAEQDSGLTFNGLANAVRKCRTDFDVEIDIDPSRIARDNESSRSRTHCVVGTIRYPDGHQGKLVYLKASLTGAEPADVLEYASSHSTFPHESTSDQWFDESQFECYRKLGYHVATTTFEPAQRLERNLGIADSPCSVFAAVARIWYPPSEAIERNATKHTQTYMTLMEVLRSNPGLAFLDRELFPESNLTFAGTVTPENRRDGFYFCISLIQLLEDIWVDFRLDEELQRGSPFVEGWMSLYQGWVTRSETLQNTWTSVQGTYGARFRSFVTELRPRT
jgi:hypothetical protein